MQSRIVDVSQNDHGIVYVTMCDRINKNAFSMEMASQLSEAFVAAGDNEKCKVVIVTGYDSYFASGATKDGLLAIHNGVARFTDTDLYSMPVACPVPVIAAMQGHGIGGGFVFGLFADFVILSKESIYTTNFMRYGFTPGMGATYIVPQKLGAFLGAEMLLCARSYHGGDLEKRGVDCVIVPRVQVCQYAQELAEELAEKPRRALTALKQHLVSDLRCRLPEIVRQEIAMHEVTVHEPEVRHRIETLFGK
jgi:polyketide biosynthesis enoyl-CoA hydratase PksI